MHPSPCDLKIIRYERFPWCADAFVLSGANPLLYRQCVCYEYYVCMYTHAHILPVCMYVRLCSLGMMTTCINMYAHIYTCMNQYVTIAIVLFMRNVYM